MRFLKIIAGGVNAVKGSGSFSETRSGFTEDCLVFECSDEHEVVKTLKCSIVRGASPTIDDAILMLVLLHGENT